MAVNRLYNQISIRFAVIMSFAILTFGVLIFLSNISLTTSFNYEIGSRQNRVTSWKYVTGRTLPDITQENPQWKQSDEFTGIRKPVMDKFVFLTSIVNVNKNEDTVYIHTQSEDINVFFDGLELTGTFYTNPLTRLKMIKYPLPSGTSSGELRIIAVSGFIFDISVGIAENARIDEIKRASNTGGIIISLLFALIGLGIFVLALFLSIKLRNLGKISLSGIIIFLTSFIFMVTSRLHFSGIFNLLFFQSSEELIYPGVSQSVLVFLVFLVFSTSLWASRSRNLFPKVIISLMALATISYVILMPKSGWETVNIGYAAFLTIAALLILPYYRRLLKENHSRDRMLYFSFILVVLLTSYDLINSVIKILPGFGPVSIIGLLIYAFSLLMLSLSQSIYVNVRIDERNEQIKRNRVWIEKTIAVSAGIFTQQQLDEFCIQTAIGVKKLIESDEQERLDMPYNDKKLLVPEHVPELAVSIALKKDKKFEEIYNSGGVLDCKYEMYEKKHSNNVSEGIYFGGSYLVISLFVTNQLVAIIYFEGINGGISENLKNILTIAYSNISIALDNLKLKKEVAQTQESIFTHLAEMSESKSEETGFHIKRVAEYVKTICEAYGLPEEETRIVYIASMMHDVGKLAIPENLIQKRGNLSSEEFDTIKQHVIYGHNMLTKSQGELMRAASIIALQHHERWNGEGYLGLKGQDIHLYARITAVADVFDALTSNRTYKDTWTVQEACGLILEKSGTQFDPAVSNAFAKCMDKIIKIRQSYPDRVIS